jgi:hypothetical protein
VQFLGNGHEIAKMPQLHTVLTIARRSRRCLSSIVADETGLGRAVHPSATIAS